MTSPSTYPILCGSIAARPGRFGVAMHSAAYRAAGLAYTYVAFGTEDTAGAVQAMRTMGLRGLGVTMPHKTRIAAYLDAVDATAATIGAVNTVVNDQGRLTGYNTDWQGALDALAEAGPVEGPAVVIGAGGGARAVVYALRSQGCAVTVLNRSGERGQALAAGFGVRYGGDPERLAEAGPYRLLVHATPVGLLAPDAIAVPPEALLPGAIVLDLVAMPIETRLLAEAKARLCRTVPGIRMQLHQARRQFSLYTGREPDLAVMEQALREAFTQS